MVNDFDLILEIVRALHSLAVEGKPNRVVDNILFYNRVFNHLTLKSDHLLKSTPIDVHFVSNEGQEIARTKGASTKAWKIILPLNTLSATLFEDFLLGKVDLIELLKTKCISDGILIESDLSASLFTNGLKSWERYVDQLGYNDEKDLLLFDDKLIINHLKSNNIVWYYGKSSSGKTYMGIRELKRIHSNRLAYNPCYSPSYEFDIIQILLCYGRDICFLIDDIQCDNEKAKVLFELLNKQKNSFSERNINVFIISWSSLIEDKNFSTYTSVFPSVEANIDRYLEELRDDIVDKELLDVCGNNLALLNRARIIAHQPENGVAPVRRLFNTFVKTNDIQKLLQIYKLCILGTYEYLIPVDYMSPALNSGDLSTLKVVNHLYYAGHREICKFIYTYIENNKGQFLIEYLDAQDVIISEFIQSQEPSRQWGAIKQLIGEDGEERLEGVSPIWKGIHCFEREISEQTKKDPSWNHTPSSMYFVLKVASMLGIISEYKNVLTNFCNEFLIENGHITVKYEQIKTTEDFKSIKSCMIREDLESSFSYEKGEEFNCERAHKNWLLGLIVGLKNELLQFGKQELYDAAIKDILDAQEDEGYWYPKRVPWVSARVLIGLSQASFTAEDPRVRKGIKYLISILKDSDHWEAHTGGWNNPYETSSLCLEAIYSTRYTLNKTENKQVAKVIDYLKSTKGEWTKDNMVVDGSATACCLLKNVSYDSDLNQYIQDLCENKIYNIVTKSTESYHQSCESTQIAYYVMDFCWDVLCTRLPSLLNKFISRSMKENRTREIESPTQGTKTVDSTEIKRGDSKELHLLSQLES